MNRATIRVTGAVLLGGLLLSAPAAASTPEWKAEKCRLYTRAWDMLRGTDGLTAPFRTAQQAFIAAGCTIRGAVCPTTPAEWQVADTLTLIMVTEGATGSFLPFHCQP